MTEVASLREACRFDASAGPMFSGASTSRRQVDMTRGMAIKRGSFDAPRLRAPGSTKIVTVKNKMGRTFNISIPMSKITHPQKRLVSPIDGRWKGIDTSFVDTGDFDTDIPRDHHAATADAGDGTTCGTSSSSSSSNSSSGAEALCRDICHMSEAYLMMDRRGMVNLPQHSEKHAGPDYEDTDRKVKSRRMWFSLRHRFVEVQAVLCDGSAEAHVAKMPPSTRMALYDTCRLMSSANVFRVQKRMPYEQDRLDSDYEPADLRPLVTLLCRVVSHEPSTFFTATPEGVQRLITMAALCRETKLPIAACFHHRYQLQRQEGTWTKPRDATRRKGRKGALKWDNETEATETETDMVVILRAMIPLFQSKAASQTLLQRLALGVLQALLSLPSVRLDCGPHANQSSPDVSELLTVIDGLLGACTRQAATDAMQSFDGRDMVDLLRVVERFRRENDATVFSSAASADDHVSRFVEAFRVHVASIMGRCSQLLYKRTNGAAVQAIMHEDAMMPIIEYQKHFDAQHKDVKNNFRLGMQFAEGLKQVTLNASQSAQMVAVIDKLRDFDIQQTEAAVAPHLRDDLLSHIGMLLTSAPLVETGSMELPELVDALEALAASAVVRDHRVASSPWRLNQLLSSADQLVGVRLHVIEDLPTVARLLSSFATFHCVPSCMNRLEGALLRILSTTDVIGSHHHAPLVLLADVVQALVSLGRSGSGGAASPVVLERIARVGAPLLRASDPCAVVKFLWSLRSAQFSNITGLTLQSRKPLGSLSIAGDVTSDTLLRAAALQLEACDVLASRSVLMRKKSVAAAICGAFKGAAVRAVACSVATWRWTDDNVALDENVAFLLDVTKSAFAQRSSDNVSGGVAVPLNVAHTIASHIEAAYASRPRPFFGSKGEDASHMVSWLTAPEGCVPGPLFISVAQAWIQWSQSRLAAPKQQNKRGLVLEQLDHKGLTPAIATAKKYLHDEARYSRRSLDALLAAEYLEWFSRAAPSELEATDADAKATARVSAATAAATIVGLGLKELSDALDSASAQAASVGNRRPSGFELTHKRRLEVQQAVESQMAALESVLERSGMMQAAAEVFEAAVQG